MSGFFIAVTRLHRVCSSRGGKRATERKHTSFVAVETWQINHETIHRPPFSLNMSTSNIKRNLQGAVDEAIFNFIDVDSPDPWSFSGIFSDVVLDCRVLSFLTACSAISGEIGFYGILIDI